MKRYTEGCNGLGETFDGEWVKYEEANAEVQHLKALLRQVEEQGLGRDEYGDPVCPFCFKEEHAEDCALAEAIK